MTQLPRGFAAYVANLGIKDDTDDFVVVASEGPIATSAVFTKSRFAGPSVTLSRANTASGQAQAAIVISKNANVANGPAGDHDAAEVATLVAEQLGCATDDVVLSSTGVIGRRYPMERVRAGIAAMTAPSLTSADAVATAMMTTDTVRKVAEARIEGSDARVVGVAKGVGMIEPDMATMIAMIFTDADVARVELDNAFRSSVDRTFNCLSVDTDTSTSDTAIAMASGAAGRVSADALQRALDDVCIDLTKQLASDAEGAETLIEVNVRGARDHAQARRVAKTIVNSPLVKTAVHGADPNWGRVAMAIGKCSDDTDIDQSRVTISFGATEVYPRTVGDDVLEQLSTYMRGAEVVISANLAIGDGEATVWGCDLTDGYVRINADYTT